MSTRGTARHVRQRKLNTKQGLKVIRENEIEDAPDDESQRNIPAVETGVEKGEEVEFHLQAVISAANAAALGATSDAQNYIPTPDAVKAKGIDYDELYPKAFSQPSTYIRFSATVEDSVGASYCLNEEDAVFLAKLNDGKDVNGKDRKDKLGQCSEDLFEEVMSFFEDVSARMQPNAFIDNPPILTLAEMEQSVDESVSPDAQKWLAPVYKYWAMKKGPRPLMPSIKVRVLDQVSEADDADPYVCFRRREVRQTRKTRGRDAQVVEKLKKLRLELEQARNLVMLVAQREQMHKENLEISRKVFEERRKLKEVKITKNIIGEKGDDEELLVNQKPVAKQKPRPDPSQQRPSTIRIRSTGGASAPDTDLELLSERHAEAEEHVRNNIETRKEQHKKWNHHWIDRTWAPLTPPPDDFDEEMLWTSLLPETFGLPTPPPSLPSVSREASEVKDGDVEMKDRPPLEEEKPVEAGAQRAFSPEIDFNIFHVPGAWPVSEDEYVPVKREMNPSCRIRFGRGGRRFLETRKRKPRGHLCRGVVSDSESDDDEGPEYFPVSDRKIFDYRCALNSRARPDGQGEQRRQWPSGDQSAAQQQAQVGQQQAAAGSAG